MLEIHEQDGGETESFLRANNNNNRASKAKKTGRKHSSSVLLLIFLVLLTAIICLLFASGYSFVGPEVELDKETAQRQRTPPILSRIENRNNSTKSNLPTGIEKRSKFDVRDDVSAGQIEKLNSDALVNNSEDLEESTTKLPELPTISDDKIIKPLSDVPDSMDKESGAEAISSLEVPLDSKERPEFASEEYLEETDALIERAMSAILAEYGQQPLDYHSNQSCPMFAWDKVNLELENPAPEAFRNRGSRGNGGWTSPRSWTGLVLRLLQAMSTRGTFTVVLGGHSAATGHGNHFHQSYMMQFHRVMAPVFNQLGVQLISRNMAQGGLGTVHSSMGSASIYGNEIDLMLWDSGMTENHKPEHIDLFFRQALMSDGRVPVVWSAGGKFELLRMYHNEADADVGEFGRGMDGIPETTSEQQAKELPWAVRHLKCSDDRPDLCKHPYKYCATCWIPRDDKIKPAQKQNDPFKGQVTWHPGWRSHQLTGRFLAFSLLQALRDAIDMIRKDGETLLKIDMTPYYDNIRSKMQKLDPSLGFCYRINTTLPERMCRVSMKGRTQYTPRSNPEETSITSIIKPEPLEGYVPKNKLRPLYDGPNVYNPCLDLPDGAVDVVARIIGNNNFTIRRRELLNAAQEPIANQMISSQRDLEAVQTDEALNATKTGGETIVPGRGWQVFGEPQGYCDGTYDAVCARSTRNRCVLAGHHDERGDVLGSEMAGWLVLQLPRAEVIEGIIVLKLNTWHEPHDNARTYSWKTINDVQSPEEKRQNFTDPSQRKLEDLMENIDNQKYHHKSRRLRHQQYETPDLPNYFQFEYAIDGQITTLNRTEFLDRKKDIQRVVETLTLLDDPYYFKSSSSDQLLASRPIIEVAIRLRGCYHRCVFGVSHVYWS